MSENGKKYIFKCFLDELSNEMKTILDEQNLVVVQAGDENEGVEYLCTLINNDTLDQLTKIKGKVLILSNDKSINDFEIGNDLGILNLDLLQYDFGKLILLRFLGHSDSLSISKDKDQKVFTFKITNLVSSGYYADIITQFAISSGFDFLQVRDYFMQITRFFIELKRKGTLALPLEVDFVASNEQMSLQCHCESSSILLSPIIKNSFMTFDNGNKGPLALALNLSSCLDVYYLKSASRFVVTALWIKELPVAIPSLFIAEIESFKVEDITHAENTQIRSDREEVADKDVFIDEEKDSSATILTTEAIANEGVFTDEEDTSQAISSSDDEDTSQVISSSDEEDTSQVISSSDEEDTSQAIFSSDEEDTSQAIFSTDEEDTSLAIFSTDEDASGISGEVAPPSLASDLNNEQVNNFLLQIDPIKLKELFSNSIENLSFVDTKECLDVGDQANQDFFETLNIEFDIDDPGSSYLKLQQSLIERTQTFFDSFSADLNGFNLALEFQKNLNLDLKQDLLKVEGYYKLLLKKILEVVRNESPELLDEFQKKSVENNPSSSKNGDSNNDVIILKLNTENKRLTSQIDILENRLHLFEESSSKKIVDELSKKDSHINILNEKNKKAFLSLEKLKGINQQVMSENSQLKRENQSQRLILDQNQGESEKENKSASVFKNTEKDKEIDKLKDIANTLVGDKKAMEDKLNAYQLKIKQLEHKNKLMTNQINSGQKDNKSKNKNANSSGQLALEKKVKSYEIMLVKMKEAEIKNGQSLIQSKKEAITKKNEIEILKKKMEDLERKLAISEKKAA